MKKHTLNFVLFFALAIGSAYGQTKTNLKGTAKLLQYLGTTVKYPEKAKQADVQGNSLVLFTVAKGKITEVKVDHELGNGTDIEVVNGLLAFNDYAHIKPGKYAIKTSFKLDGSTAENRNVAIVLNNAYTPLNLAVVAYAPKQTTFKIIESKSTTKTPLYVVDGKKISEAELKNIDPNTIESINVYTKESTITAYGLEGANGVVLINLKKTKPKTN